ncbi:MAG: divergent polysaccharide deacetylase family protein [Candidatus Omnitrophota bacterium]|nr:MAG: divergent polysaccharide deacetylase family protein [Candidatus Omnitrophota bacterium]
MDKAWRLILLLIVIVVPFLFYKSFIGRESRQESGLPRISKTTQFREPKVALVFDDLGETLKDLRQIYALDIPVSVSVIPKLKFSKNIAHIAYRCGFSVLIHLPLEPKEKDSYSARRYNFINSTLSEREIKFLLRQYLNSIRIAIGVNHHMGSAATQDAELMRIVLKEIKNKGLIYIDSRTSMQSCAYRIAKEEGLVCGYNEGFLDSVNTVPAIEAKLTELIQKAKEKGKIIIIAHPRENTFSVLRQKLSVLKKNVKFVTLKDYFEL